MNDVATKVSDIVLTCIAGLDAAQDHQSFKEAESAARRLSPHDQLHVVDAYRAARDRITK